MSKKQGRGNTWDVEISDDGAFVRSPTSFRHQVKADGSTPFAPEAGRYHLYVSLACPWAHRTLIVRKLKGLEAAISVDVVAPLLDDRGWSFDTSFTGSTGDRVNAYELLSQVYDAADANYAGRITVPVLWDKKTSTIVNNESSEIIRMLNSEFEDFCSGPARDFYPEDLAEQIDSLNDWIYPSINNGVYRCGFAKKQGAFNQAFEELFTALDKVESILTDTRFLTGNNLTEADIRLFTTLVRFDAVYHTHFKCNLKRIQDYPGLNRFLNDIYTIEGVADTVDMAQIKYHYYASHTHINPFGIVPNGPELNFLPTEDNQS